MPEIKLYMLIKIGKREHIQMLQDKGLLYLNTVNYFRSLEELQKGDENEGIIRIEQVDWIKIEVGGKFIELRKNAKIDNLSSGQLRINKLDLVGNIYSMIALSSNRIANSVICNELNTKLGDTFLIITDAKQFLSRVSSQLNNLGLKHQFNFVTYYDTHSYTGDLSIFNKENRFKHQSEFRIFVKNQTDKPIKIKIGPINEISRIFPIDLFNSLRFEYRKTSNV